MNNIKRLLIDIILVVIITALFMTEAYELLPNPMQLVALKMLIVSMAITHAHIVGKLLFGTVSWAGELRTHHFARLALYVTFPICYSIGG